MNEARFRIVKTLILSDFPLTLTQVANESGVPKQNVNYHMPPLVACGLVLPLEGGTYMTQRVFDYSPQMLEELRPLIDFVVENIDASSADSLDEAVTSVLTMFFTLLTCKQDENGETVVEL